MIFIETLEVALITPLSEKKSVLLCHNEMAVRDVLYYLLSEIEFSE
jgi:hypothetical protein